MADGYNMPHTGGGGRSNGVGVIVNVEISKGVVRVERWQGRIIAVRMMRYNCGRFQCIHLCG